MNDIIHDKENRKFILPLEDGEQAIVSYSLEGEKLLPPSRFRLNDRLLVYSEVPGHLRGQSIGKELVEKTFDKIASEGLKAKAICSYIVLVAMRNNKWNGTIEY